MVIVVVMITIIIITIIIIATMKIMKIRRRRRRVIVIIIAITNNNSWAPRLETVPKTPKPRPARLGDGTQTGRDVPGLVGSLYESGFKSGVLRGFYSKVRWFLSCGLVRFRV